MRNEVKSRSAGEREELFGTIARKTESKIVLLVLDGVGGLPIVEGKTELETAHTPNLDALAAKSIGGLTDPISFGITPGSGPAHLSLFGYDPLKYQIGRGVLEALGVGLEMTRDDLAARGNFATADSEGKITDRRAGRIPTEKNKQLCAILQKEIKTVGATRVIIHPGKEHRFVLILRGKDLSGTVTETDPQKTGVPALPCQALLPEAKRTAEIVNKFIARANEILRAYSPANTILLRGLAKYPEIPSMAKIYELTPAAIATYPMYKGLAKLVGMGILETAETIENEFETLRNNFNTYDFFYLHIKKTDSYGEDGNFAKKVETIEIVDKLIPDILSLNPDVLVVTGDHSTPALLKSHSWHPNPFLLWSRYNIPDRIKKFSEIECRKGALGRFPALEAVPLMLANALKLTKFGA